MKPTSISAEALFEAHREAMRWEWIAGHAHPERRFDEPPCATRARRPTWWAT
jgi:HPr kinase/phosphorylase